MRNLKLLLAGAAFLAMVPASAFAADLPARVAPPVYSPPPPIPTFTWTGFHVGGNAGYAFGQERTNTYYLPDGSVAGAPATDGLLAVANGNRDGFTGGGQIGYDYEIGRGAFGGLGNLAGPAGGVVIGVEADAQYLGIGGNNGNYAFFPSSAASAGAFANGPAVSRDRANNRFFGTVRGRLGYAFDRFLAFGTGGFAYDGNATGYAYGGGLSYAFTNNWVVSAEYLRVNLDRGYGSNASYDAGANVVYVNGNGGRNEFNVIRGKIDYKFDTFSALAAPVVARY